MAAKPPADGEVIQAQEEVRAALKEASPPHEPFAGSRAGRSRWWAAGYVVAIILLVSLLQVIDSGVFLSPDSLAYSWGWKLARGALIITVIMMLARSADILLIERVDSAVARYHLRQVLGLVSVLTACLVGVSLLFTNWYSAVASLGLVSLILGLALQSPLTSFFGWVYIVVRAPFRVGDRIRIDDATGDVISISYLDTTLWEFGGPYLSTDHPSGRIIKFPNSKVLNSTVYNYSWPLFPFIWNEIKLSIAYQSDLELVARIMQEVAKEELGELMGQRVKVYKGLLAQTPVDHLTVQEEPTVIFRVNENTWIEAILRYVVSPKEQGRVKSRLIPKLVQRLNEYPDAVLFPRSNLR
jgi:small-conductance mechanosensitive channel